MVAVLCLFCLTCVPLGTALVKTQDDSLMNKEEILSVETSSKGSFGTHKVLAEVGTATWCPYCPSMGYWISKVQGDFQYISLVGDKNGVAAARISELGITGYPTAVFDGGYTRVIGGQSNVNNLQNAYNICSSRSVADVTITPQAIWKDDGSMDILVYVDNRGSLTYTGHLHVYVVEKVSRWMEYDGAPYRNAMLSYAFNQDIQIAAGDTWIGETKGYSYPEITMDNTLIVASVFSSSMYVDDTATINPTTGGGGGGGGSDPKPAPVIQIVSPRDQAIVNGTLIISGVAHHPEGDGLLKWVFVKINDGSWKKAEGTVDWSYEWDTTSVEDGIHYISAISSDGTRESGMKMISVTVQNTEPEPDENIPDLEGTADLSWSQIQPGIEISGEIIIRNNGDPTSTLDWTVFSYPSWGLWTFHPLSGTDLTPENGEFIIHLNVGVPDEKNQEFSGTVKIINNEDPSDFIELSVSLATPKQSRFVDIFEPFLRFLPRFSWLANYFL